MIGVWEAADACSSNPVSTIHVAEDHKQFCVSLQAPVRSAIVNDAVVFLVAERKTCGRYSRRKAVTEQVKIEPALCEPETQVSRGSLSKD